MTNQPSDPQRVALDVAGTRWLVDLSAHGRAGPAMARAIHQLWWRSTATPTGDERVVEVVPEGWGEIGEGAERIVSAADPASFPYAFSRALTQLTIQRRAGSALLLHAAAVASPDGQRALVLVAASGTGKSRAARTLGRHFGYLTDELAVVEPDLTVSSYPKPVSLVASDRPGDKDEWSPDELGLAPTPAHRPELAAVALLVREPRSEPALTRPGLVDALLDLIGHSSSIWMLDRPLAHLASGATRGGGPFRLTYDEIESCRAIVGRLLEESGPRRQAAPSEAAPSEAALSEAALSEAAYVAHAPTDAQTWRREVPAEEIGAGAPLDGHARFVRAPWTDAVEVQGEVLLLQGPQPVRLTGLGATVWLAAGEAATLDELVATAVAAHGQHPDAHALVGDLVRQAVANGVLTAVEP